MPRTTPPRRCFKVAANFLKESSRLRLAQLIQLSKCALACVAQFSLLLKQSNRKNELYLRHAFCAHRTSLQQFGERDDSYLTPNGA